MTNTREFCKRCQCCDTYWEDCDNCGSEGFSGHDCGDDTCCCLEPEDNELCDKCCGKGGWTMCIGHCDKDWKHEKKDGKHHEN